MIHGTYVYLPIKRYDNIFVIQTIFYYRVALSVIIVTSLNFMMLGTHYKDIINHRKLYEMTRVIVFVFANFYLTPYRQKSSINVCLYRNNIRGLSIIYAIACFR